MNIPVYTYSAEGIYLPVEVALRHAKPPPIILLLCYASYVFRIPKMSTRDQEIKGTILQDRIGKA